MSLKFSRSAWRLALTALAMSSASVARATVTLEGSVDPADYLTWNESTQVRVGQNGEQGKLMIDGDHQLVCGSFRFGSVGGVGTLNITDGAELVSNKGMIGGYSGVSDGWFVSGTKGVAIVSGIGSKWVNNGDMHVGSPDKGGSSLTVADGGVVVTKNLFGSINSFGGNGEIHARGAVLDANMLFDKTTGLTSSLGFGSGGKLHLTVDGSGVLGAGYFANGSLAIRQAMVVNSTGGILGYEEESFGTCVVQDAGTVWNVQTDLSVGLAGSGNLLVSQGGLVRVGRNVGIGQAGTVGTASRLTVDGIDSVVCIDGSLNVGCDSSGPYLTLSTSYGPWRQRTAGEGLLSIDHGGKVFVAETTWLTPLGGTGRVQFGDGGGMLTTKSLFVSATQLVGTGTINTQGLVGDLDLVFDTDRKAKQSFLLHGSNQNITVNLDTGNGVLGAGYQHEGSLTIKDGVRVQSVDGYLGYKTDAIGQAFVDSEGSTWDIHGRLVLGDQGQGVLNVTRGGKVTVSDAMSIGHYTGSVGMVNVDGAGSMVSCGEVAIGLGTCNFKIANGGKMVVSGDLFWGTSTFWDSVGKANFFIDGHQSMLSIEGDWSVEDALIQQGGIVQVNGNVGVSGRKDIMGSATERRGFVDVNGVGSKWTVGGDLSVKNGELKIRSGANVSVNGNVIMGTNEWGYFSGSVSGDGIVGRDASLNVDGSLTVIRGNILVKENGLVSVRNQVVIGTATPTNLGFTNNWLYVKKGGRLSASSMILNPMTLAYMFSRNLLLEVGSNGGLTIDDVFENNGLVALYADANLASGKYTPISAGTWTGSGSIYAVGGKWNYVTHELTVSDAEAVASGQAVYFDRSSTQRIVVTDAVSGRHLGISFVSSGSTAYQTFSATWLLETDMSSLSQFLEPNEVALVGWNILNNPVGPVYVPPGNETYLSFEVGAIFDEEALELWWFDGTNWRNMYSTFSCRDEYVNLRSFSLDNGYYVLVIPEPASLGLLALVGAMATLRRSRA